MPKPQNVHISVISPVYKAKNLLIELVGRIESTLQAITIDYEIILINDACPEDSWSVIAALSAKNQKIKGINLSRNFGQHYAICAGLQHAKGEWMIVMDCDLQDVPEEITKLYTKATKENFDIVFASRENREDGFLKKLSSMLFYKCLGYLTNSEQDHKVANFGIYHKKVIQAVNQMTERIKYFPTMIRWVGFRSTKVEVNHAARKEGTSSYNLTKLLKLAVEIILANSDKPMKLMVRFGLFLSGLSFLAAIVIIIRWLLGSIEVLGYASLITSIWFFSGVIILMLGVIGLYLGKTFEGVKNRPDYIVSETTNIE